MLPSTLQGSAFVAMFDLVPDEDKPACADRIVLQTMGYKGSTMPNMTRREKDAYMIIRTRDRFSIPYSIMKPVLERFPQEYGICLDISDEPNITVKLDICSRGYRIQQTTYGNYEKCYASDFDNYLYSCHAERCKITLYIDNELCEWFETIRAI
jgi:hypothetical protein